MSVKYIFCIRTGRCGTQYLSKLLGALDKSKSYHEQRPRLNGNLMQEYLRGDKSKLRVEIPKKVKIIKNDTSEIYIDTSHLFIKGFGWEIPKFILENEIGVIILKRDVEKVVMSLFRVNTGPFCYIGRKWIVVPNGNNLSKPPINYFWYTIYRAILKFYWLIKGENRTIYKTYPKYFIKKSLMLLKWYYNETYVLSLKFMLRFPKIKYVPIDLNELNTIKGFEKIIEGFGLESNYNPKRIIKLLGKSINEKKIFK